MGDDLLVHCKIGGRLRKDGAAQKGHAYASAHKQNHNLRMSPEIATNSRSNLEENQFGPYLMENHKRRSNTNQTTPKKSESANSSPSIIAKLMGLKDLPPEKANKKSGGVFHKPSLSGFLNNSNVEFKDVFEVIEERNWQQDKGQNRKFKEFEGDFENYRDNFVKNIEKSNPLFAKHLLDLKCYPPHLHKGMVSRLKSGYVYDRVLSKNQKLRNLDQRNNCSDHDHIVVLDPKMGNFDQDQMFHRTLHENYLEDLQNRRDKMWRFENGGYEGDEYCKKNILKLEKLRRFDSNVSNEETKSLAEMLATPDMERFEKNFDSHKYRRNFLKSKFAREGYYEKVEGSFAKLPQDISPIEREDVVKLRARKHKLRENCTLKGNLASRSCEQEMLLERHDRRGENGNKFETEEKMLFTIDEEQNAAPTTTQICAKEAKKYRNAKKVLNGEKEKCISVMKFNRNTNSNEEEIPSPISVLEPTPIETESSCSSFLKPDSDLHETDTQITEELGVCISSDDDSKGTTCNDKNSILNQLRDQEEREFSYLLDMLIQSGVHRICPGTHLKTYHSREFPVDPRLFDRLEKRYGHMLTWSKSDRKLLFDLVNSVIARVLAPFLDTHPWVRCGSHAEPMWGPEGLVERVWLDLSKERKKFTMGNEEEKMLDLSLFENLGDDINVIGKQIERMLTDDILEEIVLEYISALIKHQNIRCTPTISISPTGTSPKPGIDRH
ncbi:hypothetical protein FCM35_KLT05306 [Carex littledalei]|uniref:DUF4378 domain-containing protein n=1 Tax=Carex littledalei TaxID=544730 RepID=A0A833QMT3_9POAL|nr:hypothetical protein FCM35_KLT05306 [Carex littledalei]